MRGVHRWLAVSSVVAIAVTVCAFTAHHALAPRTFVLQLSDDTLPADGFSSKELKVRSSSGRDLRDLQVKVQNPRAASVEWLAIEQNSATAVLRAGVLPGVTKLRVSAPGFVAQEIPLETVLDTSDTFRDGIPDFLRLHDPADRAAFRRWFTLMAETQYYREGALPAEIDDCAALLRFAYREALREHNAGWARATALPVPASAVNVRQFEYPYTPLAAALFRVQGGSFAAADLSDGAFAQFADAETLWRYNTFSVGRDFTRARPGDLLFFRQDGQKQPFHAMIFLGRSQVEAGNEQYIIYHTGASGKSPGLIRRWSVAELINYPEARWRPVPSNPVFLGIYRWNILRGGE